VDNTSRTFANYGTGIVTLANIDTSAGAAVRVAFDNAQLATPGGLIVVAGTVSGPGQIETTNANSNTRLNGANTHTGQTLVSAGTLTLANTLAAQNSTVNLNGGNLFFDSTVAGNAFTFGGLAGTANLALQNNALTPAAVALTTGGNNAATSYTGVLSGPGSLTKTGTGTLTLGGSSVNVGGGIDVSGGRLTLSRSGQINLNSTGITLGTNRELVVAYGTGTLGGSITMGAGSLLSIQNGNAEGNQALRSTVNTNIVLASGSGSANAASIGGFIFGNSTVLTGTISGSGDLRWRTGILGGGSNSATVAAANNNSGWAVNSYTGATSFEGVNLTFSLASNTNNDVVNPFGDSDNAVSITGGQLRLLQTGQANNTTIIENNLSLSAGDAATTTFFREDGNLRLDGSVDITTTGTGNIRLQSRWGAANSKGLTLAGQLTGSGNTTVTRTAGEEGSVRLANNTNTYNGTITVNSAGGGAGILVLEANGAATSARLNLASSGAHLNINTANATIAELSGTTGSQVSARSAGQTLTVNQSTDTTFAGVLGGTGVAGSNAGLVLVKDGGGTLTLSGINTHTGGTTVAAGTLELAISGGLGFFPGANTVSNKITGTGTALFSGVFSIDLTNAAIANGNSWQLASVASQSFDQESFLVTSNLGDFSASGGVHTLVNGVHTWTFTESDGTLRLSVAAGYANWAATHAPSQTASQDFDNDGVPNGIEYVLGGTKDTNDLGKLPGPGIQGADFTVSFIRATASKTPDTTVTIEVGSTLGSWPLSFDVATAPEITTTPVNDDWEQVILTIPRGTDTRKFARLVVEID
jgi:autotransporter-associated beta strand protein